MATTRLPYMASPGLIPKIISKIQEARRPERFTQDFLETKLGYSGGSAMAFIPLLKRMGFLASDGTPTPLYDRLRDSATQAAAVADGMRRAYSEMFDRNVYAGDLGKDKLTALVVEITGAAKDDRTAQLTVSTFWTLKQLADFEPKSTDEISETKSHQPPPPLPATATTLPDLQDKIGLSLSYTINLVLPETTNPDVFSSIFKALRENLLRQ